MGSPAPIEDAVVAEALRQWRKQPWERAHWAALTDRLIELDAPAEILESLEDFGDACDEFADDLRRLSRRKVRGKLLEWRWVMAGLRRSLTFGHDYEVDIPF